MGFFQQREDRIVEKVLSVIDVAPYGQLTGFVDAAKESADDHLLFRLLDLGQLEDGAAAGAVEFGKLYVLVCVEDAVRAVETGVQAPEQALNG